VVEAWKSGFNDLALGSRIIRNPRALFS